MTHFKPARLHGYLLIALMALFVATALVAHATGIGVGSESLTVSQSAASVPCAAQVSMSNFAYTPATVTITAGCSVTWTNTVATKHSSTSDATSGNTTDPWDSGEFRQSDPPFTRVFNVTGTFSYYCTVHNGMTGTVVVN